MTYQGVRPLRFDEAMGRLWLLDQRKLPGEEVWVELDDIEAVARAIEDLIVRGAPAIACAAAAGIAVAAQAFPEDSAGFRAAVEVACRRLSRTRPTAVNLFVALEQIRTTLASAAADASVPSLRQAITDTARRHIADDLSSCLRMGEYGAPLLPDAGGVLTHCNAGALATAGYGTALGVIRRAHEIGKRIRVFADETRPVLQGARLTAWELHRDGIPVEIICDDMAGAFMARGEIQAAVVGADRIVRNGDVANKIGTYAVAVLCRYHDIPFYVAAPWTTIDLSLASGTQIPIEERDGNEVRRHGDQILAPAGVPVRNPAFDVTPAALVTGIITERGVFAPGALAAAGAGP